MIIVMQVGATPAQVEAVCAVLKSKGAEPLVLPGEGRIAIGVPSALTNDKREDIESALGLLDGISRITQTTAPYKLTSKEYHPDKTVVSVKGVDIGAPNTFVIMAGPCSIESEAQFTQAADVVKGAGLKVIRGGAFKPRTSPYAFQGLAEEGLKIMRKVADAHQLATISEVMSGDLVPLVAEYVDILQIGARSMQNFPLLIQAGRSGKPVFLKRGPSATIDEWLLAAEYVVNEGNPNVILCERGITAFDRAYTRNVLDLAAVAVINDVSHLPIIVDPSHGTGIAKYVPAMAKSALVSGASGMMVEVHPDPKSALSDGSQSLTPQVFNNLVSDLRKLGEATGVTIC